MERSQYLFRYRSGDGRARARGRAGARALAGFGLLLLSLGGARAEAPSAERFEAIAPVVIRDLEAGRVAGAVVLVGEHGRVAYRSAFGLLRSEPSVSPLRSDDIFDLASLTKVVATTTAVMQLAEAGRIDIDAPVARYWPGFGANGKDAVTVRQLLTHTSGLAPDLDASTLRGGEDALSRVAAAKPVRPPGTAFVYSDINFIALGALVARVSGEPLDAYAEAHIFKPLGMADTGFNPPASLRSRIAATVREQGRLRWGEVQDPTAYRMGGVAGHAGLFSTADDLARFASMLLQGGALDGVRVLRPETVALMTRAISVPGGARRGLGWDMGSAYSVDMDVAFGPASFGHTGYTGCLMWIDPASESFLLVLTSRLHPDGRGDVKPLRQDLGRLVGALTRAPAAQTASLAGR